MSYYKHESSYVDEGCQIGDGTKIWHFSHIMSNCKIGKDCNIGQNVVISPDVILGNNVKIQNNVSVYTGVIAEDDVFMGPSMVFTNVINPRSHVSRKDEYKTTILKKGCSVGANATIVCGHTIGEYALIGAGTVVTKDIKPFVYTCDDRHQRLLDEQYDELKDGFYFFNAGEKGRIAYYTDKNNCCDLALECGFNIPKKEVIKVGEVPQNVPYPIFIKTLTPYSMGWKHDVGIYYNQQDLAESFPNYKSNEPLIAQEYIQKKGELSMQGIAINAGQEVYIPFERMYLRYSDTSFGGYMYYQPFENKELLSKIQTMIQAIRYSGCFEIEFLVDQSDQLYFLEINLRFSASNYGVYYGGCNQPYLWAISTLLGNIPVTHIKIKKGKFYVMNEIIDIRYAKSIGIFLDKRIHFN